MTQQTQSTSRSRAGRRAGRLLIASGHEISFAPNGRAKPTTQDAAIWWESLSLMEQAALYEKALGGADLDAESAISEYRNPARA